MKSIRIIYLFLVSLSQVHVLALTDEECCLRTSHRSYRGDLLQSFNKFSDNVREFFRFPITKLETKGRRLKKAFNAFVRELTKKDNAKNMTKLTEYSNVNEAFDSILSAPQLISLHGYKSEVHNVLTADGYILTIHRILPFLVNKNKTKNRVALLHHGILGSSDDWLLLGPRKALPYLLSNAGYDVWLANARGNKYSRAHSSRSIDSYDFWDFSWHEIGQFDLSAVIDYVRLLTEGKSLIDYIGHSMGTTALLVLLSTLPQYNLVLRSAIFLGPLAFMYNSKGPLRLLTEFQTKTGITSLDFLGETEFMPFETFPRTVIENFCIGDDKLCLNPWLLMANGGKKIFDEKLKNSILTRVPAGGSTKTITHYTQLVRSGQFQMFDLGPSNNMKKYGLRSPPSYRLNDVTLPVALFTSNNDWLSTLPDVLSLLPNLPNPMVHHVIRRDGFSHTDFIWAEDAPHVLYYIIIDMLGSVKPIHMMNFRLK